MNGDGSTIRSRRRSTPIALILLALACAAAAPLCDARRSASSFHPKTSSVKRSANEKQHRAARRAPPPTKHRAERAPQIISRGGGGEDGKSSLTTATFNLIKGIVGVGVLSLPAGVAAFGDAKSAVLPAVALIAFVGIMSGYNFSLIGRVCAYTGATSYRNAWEESIGATTAWIPAVACTFKTFVAVLSYSMVLAETFKGIAEAANVGASRTQVLVTLTAVLLLPLCLMKNLASLAPFSLLGIMGMVFTVLCMAMRFLDGSYGKGGKFLKDVAKAPLFGTKGASAVFTPSACILVCMLSSAYMAHFNAPKFYIELEDNTIPRFNTLVSTSFGAAITVFALSTALGFATFGKNCAGFILSNYSSKDTLIGLSRIAVAISLIFTYPLVFVGLRDGVISLLGVPKEKQTNANLDKLTVVLLTLITIAASNLKDVSLVTALGGATLGNALIYIFPALMFNAVVKGKGDEASSGLKRETYFASFSMLLGIVLGCIGANMSLKGAGGH